MATSKPVKPSTPEDLTTLLDKLRQWAVTPKGAPAQPAYNPLPASTSSKVYVPMMNAPASQAPAKSSPKSTPKTTQKAAQPKTQKAAPLTVEVNVPRQRGQKYDIGKTYYTDAGMESLRSDTTRAAEDARRQRNQAGGYAALQQTGYEPWTKRESGVTQVTRQDAQLTPVAQQMAGLAAQPASNQRAIPTTDVEKLQTARDIVRQYTGVDTAAMEYKGLFDTLSTYQPSQDIFPQYMNDILWLTTILEQ